MSTILITGGTGLIGSALTKELVAHRHHVIILTRTAKTSDTERVSYALWNTDNQTIDEDAVAKADFIVHLAGAGVAEKRWTENRKKEIIESRTRSSKLLIKALQETPNKVKAVISASAAGWYGEDKKPANNQKGFTEEALPHEDFLGKTCKLWEESIAPVEKLGKRLVKLRIGIVLSNEGGALVEFKKPLQFGIAAVLGSGRQVISWTHIADIVRMFVYALQNESMTGAYNAVAPNPVTNRELTLTLAKKMRGRFFIPIHVPASLIKLIFGQVSVEVLKSTTVSCEKIMTAGFSFMHPTVDAALSNFIEVSDD
jgi:uncharacterized protein (TIGR01777 family)